MSPKRIPMFNEEPSSITYMFSRNGKKSKNNHSEAKRIAKLLLKIRRMMDIAVLSIDQFYQIFLADGNKIENNPSDAKNCNKQIETIPSWLPITNETKSDAFHRCFDQKEESEERRDQRWNFGDLFIGFPWFVQESTVEQNQNGRWFFEQAILCDIEDVRPKFTIFWSRWCT